MSKRTRWHHSNTDFGSAFGAIAVINILLASWLEGWIQIDAVVIMVLLVGVGSYRLRVNATTEAEQQK